MADDARISAAIRGDADALGFLLEDYGPAVRRTVAASIPAQFRSVLAEDDVMQQTYADAFCSICRFVPLGNGAFRAWLSAIAQANLRDAVKALEAERRGGSYRRVTTLPGENPSFDLLDVLSSSGTSPTGCASRAEAQEVVGRAVQSLPPAYRTVIMMMDLEGQPASQIAKSMGRSPGAVYMLRARAYDRLRDALGASGKFFSQVR